MILEIIIKNCIDRDYVKNYYRIYFETEVDYFEVSLEINNFIVLQVDQDSLKDIKEKENIKIII